MEKFKQLARIKEIYTKGENIIKFLRDNNNSDQNCVEDILISYDFQAGSYIKSFSLNPEYKNKYCKSLAKILKDLTEFDSILEVGVGEGTTLLPLLKNLENQPQNIFGFDISWSRLKFAKELFSDFNISDIKLFTANLFEIPLMDNSIDIVYTSHSIEPNGGKEKEALKELYRITGKYLVLLEPSFEFANEEAKARMIEHGYITQLYSAAKELGYKIVEHRLFDYCANPLNPTGLMIIEKNSPEFSTSDLRCPITLSELNKIDNSMLYSKESHLSYPIVGGIPCLLKENSILTTHLLTNYNEFKVQNGISFNY